MERKTQNERRETRDERQFSGSAMILVVVLTSLLAIIGVIFLLSSRVDSTSTSAIADNENLNLAVDTVISKISEELVLDIPGDPYIPQEYYDYPDACNAWLASLEPSDSNVWPHITDLYSNLGPLLAYNLPPDVNYEHYDPAGEGIPIDADGDGISDSRWVQIRDVNSSKGKPIYAAVRIIDNGGMLNVNTGYKFDPCDSTRVDGSSQTQINLMALSWRPTDPNSSYNPLRGDDLLVARANYPASGLDPNDLGLYASDVIWQYGNPDGNYTPFDISDELEMRYRFLLDKPDINTRLESWGNQFDSAHKYPFDNSSGNNKSDWFPTAYDSGSLTSAYTYRHIATIQNLDRVIRPNGEKMLNINSAAVTNNKDAIYTAIRAGLDPNVPDSTARQITANLIDYIDADDDVTVVSDINAMTGLPEYCYGFETPCIYISEIAQRFIRFDPNKPDAKSYAIELYKPYWEDHFPSTDPNDGWQLIMPTTYLPPIPIIWSGSNRFHVVETIDITAPIEVNFTDVNGPNDINEPNNPRTAQQVPFLAFSGGEEIDLQRLIPSTGKYITVDYVWVPDPNASVGWLKVFDVCDINARAYSYQRDIGQGINPHKCIRGRPVAPKLGLWSGDFGVFPPPSIGGPNPWTSDPPEPYVAPYIIQAHPANRFLTNIGDIGKLFRKDAYRQVTSADTDATSKIDLNEPAYQHLFDYLTVMDPTQHTTTDPCGTETRVKGRININTAPWYVLAQLPWVSQRIGWNDYALARSIVANRDLVGPFQSIGQLNRVVTADPSSSINFFARNGIDDGYPDLTPNDLAIDDFEERDAIFARISDLVTVRSDVFTAYILVRIGPDGSQKRVVAILDRSGVTPNPNYPLTSPIPYIGKVKVIAIQQVPDAR